MMMMISLILNSERKEPTLQMDKEEIKRVKNHLLEMKFQWLQDNNIIIIQACTTTRLMKTVMKIIGKKIKAG